MRFRLSGGLGDELALTALLREYKKAYKDEMVLVEGLGHPEILIGNPWVGWGNSDNGRFVKLMTQAYEDLGSIPHAYAKQAGFDKLYDDTPEIFLTDEERKVGRDRLYPSPDIVQAIAFDPRAKWPSRRWPLASWSELVKRVGQEYRTVEVGQAGKGDDYGFDLTGRIGADLDCVDKYSIRETAAIIRSCALFVGNDSGLIQLAAAVGTPQVAIYSIKPWYSRAYWNTTPVFLYEKCGVTCLEYCRRSKAEGGFCLDKLDIERVEGAIEVALRRHP